MIGYLLFALFTALAGVSTYLTAADYGMWVGTGQDPLFTPAHKLVLTVCLVMLGYILMGAGRLRRKGYGWVGLGQLFLLGFLFGEAMPKVPAAPELERVSTYRPGDVQSLHQTLSRLAQREWDIERLNAEIAQKRAFHLRAKQRGTAGREV